MGAPAGNCNNPNGRPKGRANEKTVEMKSALHKAFEQMGGIRRLAEWAENEPTEFYKLWIKMLPREMVLEAGEKPFSFTIITGVPDPEVNKPNA